MSKRRRINKRRRAFRVSGRPCISPRGALAFSRTVRYSTEHPAHLLAGVTMPWECEVITCWRAALAAEADRYHWRDAIKHKVQNGLIPAFRLVRDVQRLRREQRQDRRVTISVGLVQLEGYDEPITGRPGVLYARLGGRSERESLDVAFARTQALKDGMSDGVSFGAIGVRVDDHVGRVRGVVVWENNTGASALYEIEHGPDGPDKLRRLARRALRREARRILGHVERALRRDKEKHSESEVEAEAKAEVEAKPAQAE